MSEASTKKFFTPPWDGCALRLVSDLLELARVTATLPPDDLDVLRALEAMDRGEITARHARRVCAEDYLRGVAGQ